jgi:hypothetical protein
MQQYDETLARGELRLEKAGYVFHHETVLSHGKSMVANGLAVPARNAGKAVGDVGYLDIEGRWVQKVEPSTR